MEVINMRFKGIDEAIAAYMRREGLTQKQVAEKLGMAENTLSWKRRGIREFTLGEAIKVAKLTGSSLDEMTYEEAV